MNEIVKQQNEKNKHATSSSLLAVFIHSYFIIRIIGFGQAFWCLLYFDEVENYDKLCERDSNAVKLYDT